VKLRSFPRCVRAICIALFPFHRSHPQKEAKRYQIEDLKEFLSKQGIWGIDDE